LTNIQAGGALPNLQNFTDFGLAAEYNASVPHAIWTVDSSAYSKTYLSYSTSLNERANAFGGGATLDGDPQYVDYWMAAVNILAVEVIDRVGITDPFPDDAFVCGDMRIFGAQPADGKIYWSGDASIISSTRYLTVLTCDVLAAIGPFSSIANQCTNYGAICTEGEFPRAWGNAIITMRAERMPRMPPPIFGCPTGDPCIVGEPTQVPGNTDFCISCDGVITEKPCANMD